jgi:lipopolysaccharide export system protein LptA
MKIFKLTILLFLAGLAAAPLLHADELVLQGNMHLQGTVTIEAGKVILRQSNGSRIAFPSNLIVSLHPGPAPAEAPGNAKNPAATSASRPATATATGLAAAPLLRADELVLQGNMHLQGTVTIEAGKVTVRQSNGSNIVFPSNLIVSLLPGPAPVEAPGNAKNPATIATKPGAEFWPPRRGERYPNLALYDHRGQLVSLASLRGKVILIEPVGMTCEACQAFAGAGKLGGYGNQPMKAGGDALEDYFPRYTGGLSLFDPRIAYVQVLLYGLQLHTPSPYDAKAWAHHFKFDERPNVYVLAGTPELMGPASFAMIPGFQLIDKNFVLRAWWYGENGTGDDLWTKLLPMVPQLLGETSH